MNKQNMQTSPLINQEKIVDALQELENEATQLFDSLDMLSTTIRTVEARLKQLKANFFFSLQIGEDLQSSLKQPQEYHEESRLAVEAYSTQIVWSLSWELDEQSKAYRLLLVSHEIENIYYSNPESESWNSREFQSKCVSKKPFIETDLQTRLRFAEHLMPFVRSFTDYINKKRASIEASLYKLPF